MFSLIQIFLSFEAGNHTDMSFYIKHANALTVLVGIRCANKCSCVTLISYLITLITRLSHRLPKTSKSGITHLFLPKGKISNNLKMAVASH